MPEITDDQLKDLVKQAFVSLDKEYFDTIGEKLAARMVMRVEGEQSNSAHLKELEQLVSCGCSATIVTILENRLWVSNIGDCQAFLCYQSKEEEEEEMRISMLSIDHYLSNEDESLRLQHLGYDPPEDGGDTGLGEYNYTRCFGNYLVKGGFKETPILATCRDDPVIAEPEIQGPIEITEDLELLVIATKSLCEAVESFSEGPAQSELARLLRQHLAAEPYNSLSTVAQSTVDHIVRMYTEREQSKATSVIKREDMTLLVRCFKSGQTTQAGGQRRMSSPKYCLENPELRQRRRDEKTLTQSSSARQPRPTRSSTTTESSGVYIAHGRELPVDEHGRIEPYVDFGPFYKLWNARAENGVSNTNHTVPNSNHE